MSIEIALAFTLGMVAGIVLDRWIVPALVDARFLWLRSRAGRDGR